MTATGVDDPDDALTDPAEAESPELELLVESLEEVEAEVPLEVGTLAVDAVAVDLPGMVAALT